MAKVIVSNVKGSSKVSPTAPNGDSWIEYWQRHTRCSLPSTCPLCRRNVPLEGAHVQSERDNKWYIFPLCHTCNENESIRFEVDESLLVPVPSNL